MPNMTSEERLRMLLGEQIPHDGTEADTMFTDKEIEDLLELGFGVPEAGAYHGWLAKMANYANLANVNEGNAARELGELHKAAQRMVNQFSGYVNSPSRGRARIGKITRLPRV